jgi:NADH:ubiquinone oxidoreductase subunit 6 (subunit J)
MLARMFGASPAPLGAVAGPSSVAAQVAENGAVGAIGIPMFLEYGVHLQITGLLLLVAVVGAVVLSKRNV